MMKTMMMKTTSMMMTTTMKTTSMMMTMTMKMMNVTAVLQEEEKRRM